MKKSWMWGLSLLLMTAMASCKPSQSAYKAAYEKAREKKVEAQTKVTDVESVVEGKVAEAKAVEEQVRERSERINAVDGNDGLLNRYNVIVGSFRQRTNAASLCERLQADGYPAVLAQNAQGMYRVVACSFDNREEAMEARKELQAKYPHFTDAWFLINK